MKRGLWKVLGERDFMKKLERIMFLLHSSGLLLIREGVTPVWEVRVPYLGVQINSEKVTSLIQERDVRDYLDDEGLIHDCKQLLKNSWTVRDMHSRRQLKK